jgi:hypothetical protein
LVKGQVAFKTTGTKVLRKVVFKLHHLSGIGRHSQKECERSFAIIATPSFFLEHLLSYSQGHRAFVMSLVINILSVDFFSLLLLLQGKKKR